MKKILVILLMIAACATAALAGGEATWSYLGDTGPEHWGDLSSNWSICSHGRYQSPIDITDAISAKLPPFSAAINATPLKFGLDGPTFSVHYESGSWITINGMRYEVLQFHFHHLSEHTLDGKHFPMECHIVLRGEGNDHADAVMGVFIEAGKENAMLNQFWGQLPRERNKPVDPVKVNVGDLLPKNKGYYTYEGSMTTPACPEGVRWFVLQDSVQASQAQIDAFIGDLTEGKTNNRPIQKTNGRVIIKAN